MIQSDISKMKQATAITTDGQTLYVADDLRIDDLPVALRLLGAIHCTIDRVSFKDIAGIDSAAMVFLLACRHKFDSTKLLLCDCPDRLVNLLNLYQLSDLFKLSE